MHLPPTRIIRDPKLCGTDSSVPQLIKQAILGMRNSAGVKDPTTCIKAFFCQSQYMPMQSQPAIMEERHRTKRHTLSLLAQPQNCQQCAMGIRTAHPNKASPHTTLRRTRKTPITLLSTHAKTRIATKVTRPAKREQMKAVFFRVTRK